METIYVILEYRMQALAVIASIGMGFLMGYVFKSSQWIDRMETTLEGLEDAYTTHAKRLTEVGMKVTNSMILELDRRMVDKSATQVKQLKEEVTMLTNDKQRLTVQLEELKSKPGEVEGNYGEEDEDGSGDGQTSYAAPTPGEEEKDRLNGFRKR